MTLLLIFGLYLKVTIRMKNPRSIDSLAVTTARQAQSQAAMIQRDLRSLRDSMSGLTRGITAPTVRTPRTRTKSTRTTSWITEAFSIGNFVSGGSLGTLGLDTGSSFYTSAAQSASDQSSILSLGQRIR